MREAIRRPALLAWRARLILPAQFSCLRSAVPILPGLAQLGLIRAWLDLGPLLNPPQPGPTFRQAMRINALGAYFFRIFFATSFFIDFFSVLGSIWAPKIVSKLAKIGKNGSSKPALFLDRFSIAFFLDFCLLLDRPTSISYWKNQYEIDILIKRAVCCWVPSWLRFGNQKLSENRSKIDPEREKTPSETDIKNDIEF